LPDDTLMAFLNLHDAFLNASLVYERMTQSPLDMDPNTAAMSDRFRLERLWVGLLAVLVEAWNSGQAAPMRRWLSTAVDTRRLVELLREAKREPARSALASTRHYMFHRDRREYWNEGRLGPCGRLDFHLALYGEFSKVFLAGFAALKSISGPQASD